MFRCPSNEKRRKDMREKLKSSERDWNLDTFIRIMNEPMFSLAKEYGQKSAGSRSLLLLCQILERQKKTTER